MCPEHKMQLSSQTVYTEFLTASTRLAPKLSTCQNEINLTKVWHIVNLAALQSFFSDSS